MAFTAFGFRTMDFIGSIDGSAGTNSSLHIYVTNDDKAAIETAGYFNPMVKRMKKGDLLLVSADRDGTAAAYLYVVQSNNGAAVGITLSVATAAD